MAKKQTAKEIAAERANLAKARAKEKSAHGKGHQTAKQLAADRANLAKARAKLKAEGKGWYAHKKGGSSKHRMYGRKKGEHLPLGAHNLAINIYRKQSKLRKPTGVNPKFKKRLAPTSYDQRGGWKLAKTHHFKKRLTIRKPKKMHVKNWRVRKGRLIPK